MSKDRLLSDEELDKAILEIPEVWAEDSFNAIRTLINTQKRLYAESERLKAKEELLQGWLSWVKSGGGRIVASQIEESLEEVRAEQRARL